MPKAVATGFMGQAGNTNIGTYSTYYDETPSERKLRVLVNRSYGSRRLKALLVALLGQAPGQSKAISHTRVAHPSAGLFNTGAVNALGGVRGTETRADQTGNASAGDVTRITTRIQKRSKPATYPADKSGFKPGNIGKLA